MSRISACLFDYGNTIVEFDRVQTDWILSELAAFLSDRVVSIDYERLHHEMRAISGLPYQKGENALREVAPLEQMKMLLEGSFEREFDSSDPLLAEADDELQRLFVESVEIDPDVADYIEQLAGRMPLAIVSNYACGATIRRSLEDLGILRHFRSVVVSGDVGFVKPHETPFRKALEELACPAERALFVGDRWDADMLGARWQGMITCHHVGYTSDRDLEGRYQSYRPDHRIQHLRDLESILT